MKIHEIPVSAFDGEIGEEVTLLEIPDLDSTEVNQGLAIARKVIKIGSVEATSIITMVNSTEVVSPNPPETLTIKGVRMEVTNEEFSDISIAPGQSLGTISIKYKIGSSLPTVEHLWYCYWEIN